MEDLLRKGVGSMSRTEVLDEIIDILIREAIREEENKKRKQVSACTKD